MLALPCSSGLISSHGLRTAQIIYLFSSGGMPSWHKSIRASQSNGGKAGSKRIRITKYRYDIMCILHTLTSNTIIPQLPS